MRSGTTTRDAALLSKVRDAVLGVEPDARVILFGSRARGDASGDSDWDLLVLLDGAVSEDRRAAIRDRLYDVELDTGAVLIALIRAADEWSSPRWRATPFHAEVTRDGVDL